MSKLPLALYAGSLFFLVFIVAPTLLRERQNKNLAGRFYGRILWRFYPLAFLLLMFYLISDANKFHALLLMSGLGVNITISYYLRKIKKSLGNIDTVPYDDPKRVFFRKLSIFSTLVFSLNFFLSLYLLLMS